MARLLVQNNESRRADRAAGAGDLRAGAAAGVLVSRRHARGHRGHQPLSDSVESAALRRASRRCRTSVASWRRKLIATRESTLREISRELHDEFGQILTAMGSMLGRAGKHAPEGSPLRDELREIGEIAQTALDNVRGLSQTLHPSILEELGLESTIDWYLSTVEKQLGIAVSYERAGTAVPIDATVGIHVYRVLQEALNNVARHSGVRRRRGSGFVSSRRAGARRRRPRQGPGCRTTRPARARAGRHARARGAPGRHDRVPPPRRLEARSCGTLQDDAQPARHRR